MNTSTSTERIVLNLRDAQALLLLYEDMAGAANAGEWERLADIERRAATIRDESLARPAVTLDMTERTLLADVLARIQHLDDNIRGQLMPAHEEARQQLAAEVRDRAVRATYGDDGTDGYQHTPRG